MIYFFPFLKYSRDLRQSSEMDFQFPEAIASFGKSFDPIPTAVTPDAAQALRLSSAGSTAPVAIIIVQGSGASMLFTKPGPPTLPAGKTFTKSHPAS